MPENHNYLVPDYFPAFHCKIGGCRHSCCEGWAISVTMKDYFKLLSVPCSEELRRRIDTALHLYDYPTETKYAQISPRYDGNCGMRLPDGRCGLHAELGEETLSDVCRLYPRGIRTDGVFEASCANSCEAVLEVLIHHQAPMSFVTMPLALDAPAGPRKTGTSPREESPLPAAPHHLAPVEEQQLRFHFIRILQNRQQSLPARLFTLREALRKAEKAIDQQDQAGLLRLLASSPLSSATPIPSIPRSLDYGLAIAEEMLKEIDKRSRSVHDYGEAVLRWFGTGEQALVNYAMAKARFEKLLPDWEIAFEQMLVNHLFFERFPFQERPMEFADEFLGVCAVYAMLRLLCLGWLAEHPSETEFIDVCAAAFRLISHTSFDAYAATRLKELGCTEESQLAALILL